MKRQKIKNLFIADKELKAIDELSWQLVRIK